MALTPLDIEHATFERAPVGYRPAAVRAFLQRVAEEHEATLRELRRLREELHERDETIAGLKEAEAELQRAVIAAERIASEMTENAREAARLIEAEARAQADVLKRSAAAEVAVALGEVARLERSQVVVREQIRGQLTAFLRALDPADGGGPRFASFVESAATGAPAATEAAAGAPRGAPATAGEGEAWAIGEEDLPG